MAKTAIKWQLSNSQCFNAAVEPYIKDFVRFKNNLKSSGLQLFSI